MFKGTRSSKHSSRSSRKTLNDLPEELLLRIFGFVRGSLPYTVGQTLLGRVCQKWRYMLLRNPKNWNYILVKYNARRQNIIVHGIPGWARHAKGYPLNVEVHMGSISFPIPSARDDFFGQLFQPIQHLVGRLKIVAFVHDFSGLRRPLRKGFPALEYLDLSLYETPGQSLSQNLFLPGGESFRSCPRLGAVRVDSGFYVQMLAEPKASSIIPWRQLSHVELDEQKGFQVEMFDVLSKCDRLASCVVTMRGMDWKSHNIAQINARVFTIPSLQSLTLRLRKSMGAGPILNKLILPSLTSLTVVPAPDETTVRIGDCIADDLVQMHDRAFFKLRKLELSCFQLSTTRFIPFLGNQTHLSILHLNNCPINTQNLLNRLVPSYQGTILPNLVEFEFDTPHRTSAGDHEIVAFLTGRYKHVPGMVQLRTVIYSDYRTMDRNALYTIYNLRERGMDVQVPGLAYNDRVNLSQVTGQNTVLLGPRRRDDSVFINIWGTNPNADQHSHAEYYFSRPGNSQIEQQMMDLCIRR